VTAAIINFWAYQETTSFKADLELLAALRALEVPATRAVIARESA
jgi:hypothetical protein